MISLCLIYYYQQEFFAICGQNMIIKSSDNQQNTKNKFIMKCNEISSYSTAYGSKIIDANKQFIHRWKLKINKCSSANYIWIGIDEEKCEWVNDLYPARSTQNYAYKANGYLWSSGHHTKYSLGYDTGDIIEMILDLSKLQMKFKKNNIDQGVAYKNIAKNKKYRLAICTLYDGDSVSIINYSNTNPKNKQN